MYETFMHTLRAFFGTGVLQTSLVIAISFVAIVLAANTSAAFRESLARVRDRKTWLSTLSATGTGLFKFLLVFVLARLLISVLFYQAQLFEQHHGRVTEKNRSAVLMKWGYPHEQRELQVAHTRKRTWVTRQLQVKKRGAESRIISESYWKDKTPPIQAVEGKLPGVLSLKEESRDVCVPQESIVSADVDVTILNNPRTLGNANYAGYNDTWNFRYVIANRSPWPTRARLSFPLPSKVGLFDNMVLRVDGTNRLDNATSAGNSVQWTLPMQPGQTSVVEVAYQSRGLEHLRYIPKRMTQTGHYRVSLRIDGIPPEELDYPIGSMPPSEQLAAITASPYTLTWKLDNALTSYDIGIKLPLAKQPDYHFSRLLKEAPVGLVLLFLLLTLPRIILGAPVQPSLVALLGTAYGLHYTFMGRLADVMNGFAQPFVCSAVLMILMAAWYRLRDRGPAWLRIQDLLAFILVVVLYPLAVVNAERTAVWMQFIIFAMLLYTCILCVTRVLASRRSQHA